VDRQRLKKAFIIATTTSLIFLRGEKSSHGIEQGTWTPTTLPSGRINTLVTTPFGVFAGEHDTRAINPPPYNGVYSSIDMGQNWVSSGLNGKGIVGLTYLGSSLYAGVFYTTTTPSGVWRSDDGGQNWVHTGITYSSASIAATPASILFGTTSRGLHRYTPNDGAWEQVIGSGFSPAIKSVSAHGTLALAAAVDNKVYLSLDEGLTWSPIGFLTGVIVNKVFVTEEAMFVGTSNNTGLFRSIDDGVSWNKVLSWGDKSAGAFTEIKGQLYVGGFSGVYNTYGIFRSPDLGDTWFDISSGLPASGSINLAMTSIHSKPDKLLSSSTITGVYAYEMPDPQAEVAPFLDLPWAYSSFQKDAQKIYSFFDHQYPLLGYGYHAEPVTTNQTTVNFYGQKKPMPYMYYSSHNGIDFTLPFGTPILAPADGYASYTYGPAVGNMIRIDHLNGYETWYMHLQNKELVVSNSTSAPAYVNAGDKVGLVGMTGNTTGPHLHFTVMRDVNQNAEFDDLPDGVVDPYGWFGRKVVDPWEIYTWTDALGNHSGSKSHYLWTQNLASGVAVLNPFGGSLEYTNKLFNFPFGATHNVSTFEIYDYLVGRGGPTDLLNLEGTGFINYAYDETGQDIESFEQDVAVQIDYSTSNIQNLDENSLKLYKSGPEDGGWTEQVSAVDTNNKKVSAVIREPGVYAVFGTAKDLEEPTTTFEISGEELNGVYINEAFVNLSATDNIGGLGVESTFYSLDQVNWEIYTSSLWIHNEGTTTILFKSIDIAGNLEPDKSVMLTIEKRGFNDSIIVEDAEFQIGTF